jgi:mevalonate kinase
MQTYQGYGFGKTILFGEHFVVHGLPGIASALQQTLTAHVKKSNTGKHVTVDNTIKFKNTKIQNFTTEMALPRIAVITNLLKINTPLHITFGGALKIANNGMGASAANLVALARALNTMFKLNLTNEQINNAAYEGEKIDHGTPSGIDNTAATYGGTFLFERNKSVRRNPSTGSGRTGAMITPINLKQPIEIVLAESGKSTPTKTVINSVKKLKEEKPKYVEEIFKNYSALVKNAYIALQNFDTKMVGSLMDENHELLKQLNVSCKELDKMVLIAKNVGALGAKLTGTGRGGLIVALTPEKNLQNKVSQALEQKGFETLKTTIQ